MSTNSNNLSGFFRELKRRKVIRRNMVYLATAFVILEFISIVSEPFGLPGWSLKATLITLSVGFIVSVIISWFYDFSADGLERTETILEKESTRPEKESGIYAWKIATVISIFIILGLVLFNIISISGKTGSRTELQKSIAVLPSVNMSSSGELKTIIPSEDLERIEGAPTVSNLLVAV